MSRLVIITAGAGFIGSSLGRLLAKRGDRVRILYDGSIGQRAYLTASSTSSSSPRSPTGRRQIALPVSASSSATDPGPPLPKIVANLPVVGRWAGPTFYAAVALRHGSAQNGRLASLPTAR